MKMIQNPIQNEDETFKHACFHSLISYIHSTVKSFLATAYASAEIGRTPVLIN